jgi:hypothetical protein
MAIVLILLFSLLMLVVHVAWRSFRNVRRREEEEARQRPEREARLAQERKARLAQERKAHQEMEELSARFAALFRQRAPTAEEGQAVPESRERDRERDLGQRGVPCSECGRLLTSAESIDRGMGPVCAERCKAARTRASEWVAS